MEFTEMEKSILKIIFKHRPIKLEYVQSVYEIVGRSFDKTILAIDLSLEFHVSLKQAAQIITRKNH